MNPHARASLRYSLATIGIYLILIPLHEAAHFVIARLENLPIASYSLLSLNPSVILGALGTLEFFLNGPVDILILIGIGLWYYWEKPFGKYLVILLVTELVADITDLIAAIRLIHR
jgi:hypothetical protein